MAGIKMLFHWRLEFNSRVLCVVSLSIKCLSPVVIIDNSEHKAFYFNDELP